MFLFALGAHYHSIIAMQFFLIASKLLMNPLGKHKLNQCYITLFQVRLHRLVSCSIEV
jgi:hypothetical protein